MSVDQTTPGIQRIDGANWHNQEEFSITWDTEAWSDIDDLYCDIYLMIYKEGPNYVLIEEGQLITEERVPYDLGEFVFQRYNRLQPLSQYRTGLFKLVPHVVGRYSG